MEELKRLTQEYKGKVEMICGFEDCMTDENICPACNLSECACLQAVIEKLKSYEDAEEHDYKADIVDDLSKYDVDSLEELVANVRNKAIDDFAELLKKRRSGNGRYMKVNCNDLELKIITDQLKVGKSNNNNWISVKDKLPEIGENVIVTTESGNVWSVCYGYAYEGDKKPRFHEWDSEMWQCFMPDVIAWMKMPKAYAKDGE